MKQASIPIETPGMQKIADFVKQQYKDAWDKMGSAGADDYWETATKDEIFEFGRFRATEDIKDFLKDESNFSV